MCEIFAGDLGENQIYKHFKRNKDDHKGFEDYLCRGKGIRSDCIKKEGDKKKKVFDEL